MISFSVERSYEESTTISEKMCRSEEWCPASTSTLTNISSNLGLENWCVLTSCLTLRESEECVSARRSEPPQKQSLPEESRLSEECLPSHGHWEESVPVKECLTRPAHSPWLARTEGGSPSNSWRTKSEEPKLTSAALPGNGGLELVSTPLTRED